MARLARLTPLWLIAEREFRAYVATSSFWVALLVGPMLMSAAAFGLHAAAKPAAPVAVAVQAEDPALAAAASAAVREAGAVEGRRMTFGVSGGPSMILRLSRPSAGVAEARFDDGFPLSAAGRELVLRTLERDAAARSLAARPGAATPLLVRQVEAPSAPEVAAPPIGRFALVMMLWLPLTGSLGMLLQAVVRERANRALESLLAAAQPWEIVFGKLAGVGGVSLLVMASWVGSGAVIGAASGAGGVVSGLLADLARPTLLLQASVVYLLAYLFYGFITVALGATAPDTSAAQNYSRPMFMVLLAAFFAALAGASGAHGLDWLVYAPPFTPFMLLLKTPSLATELAALGLLTAATAAAGWLAVRALTLKAPNARLAWPLPRRV